MTRARGLPRASDFPPGTEFIIKEFDVPLARVPGQGWVNWWGGRPSPYDVTALRVDNNWPAESFEEWVGLVEASLEKRRATSTWSRLAAALRHAIRGRRRPSP